MNKIVPILTLLVGIYWVIKGFDYGFWVRKGPGGAFIPMIAGAIVIIFSIVVFISNAKNKASGYHRFTRKDFVSVLAMVGLAAGSYIVGMTISMTLFLFSWLRFIENRKTAESLWITIITITVLYLIFVVWLLVPMPKGILGLV